MMVRPSEEMGSEPSDDAVPVDQSAVSEETSSRPSTAATGSLLNSDKDPYLTHALPPHFENDHHVADLSTPKERDKETRDSLHPVDPKSSLTSELTKWVVCVFRKLISPLFPS
jgi:hypothetical protein